MGRLLKYSEMISERVLEKPSSFLGVILSIFLGSIPLCVISGMVYQAQLRGFISNMLSNLFGLNVADTFIYWGPMFMVYVFSVMLISLSPLIIVIFIVTLTRVPIKYFLYCFFTIFAFFWLTLILPYIAYLYILYVILAIDLLYSGLTSMSAALWTMVAILYVAREKKLWEKNIDHILLLVTTFLEDLCWLFVQKERLHKASS